MDTAQRKTLWIILILGAIYFCLMIPANLTGAKDPEMLSVFEVDEYAQYEHVLRMLTPGETFYQSVRNFFVYLHYFYGFPFYFFSALSLVPVRLFSADWPANTQLIVCWLRQWVSVLPMIGAAGIFVWIFTRLKKRWVSVGLFVFLLLIPALLQNNFWWHPDSLSLFFISLVFFFLDRDQLRFGKWFSFAAAACGYATGIKYHGLYFALTIPALFLVALLQKRITFSKAVQKALTFLAIFAVFFILSNPLLLLPQERAEIIQTQQLQFEQTGVGIFTINRSAFQNGWEGLADIWVYYAEPWFFILALGGILFGFRGSQRQKLLSVMILTYLVPALGITISAATSRLHYFLPVVVPLLCGAANLFDTSPAESGNSQPHSRPLLIMLIALVGLQSGRNLITDNSLYQTQLQREANSKAIAFYQQLDQSVLPELEEDVTDRMIRVSKDWKIYFPEREGFAVQMDWDMLTLEKVKDWGPDLLILEQANINAFADPSIIDQAVNPEEMVLIQMFFSQAARDEIPGYTSVLTDNFAKAFVKVSGSEN